MTVPTAMRACNASKICFVETYKSQSTFMKRTGALERATKPGSVSANVPT